MRSTEGSRVDGQAAYVLHTHPFRETSLVIEAFVQGHGRLGLVARGARRPRSALRGALLLFQPLSLSWSGRGELRTLVRAEWQPGRPALGGRSLICAYYLNELLLKLTARDDPHERLFAAYGEALDELARSGPQAPALRRFELALLQELGYGVILDRDVERNQPVARESRYVYQVDRGPTLADSGIANGVELSGRTLMDMQSGDFSSSVTLQQSKALMRALINHCLGNQILHTRQLLRDLQEL
jgi:DNA repair protein RecO (recombination protein O)